MLLIISLSRIQPATHAMLQIEFIIKNTKLILKMTISNLKKSWTNTALFEFSLAKSDIKQLPWPKMKFRDDFLYLVLSSVFQALSQNALRSCWQQSLGKSCDLQCQSGAMTHISRKIKSRRQHALFLWFVKLMFWISSLFHHLIKITCFQKHIDSLLTDMQMPRQNMLPCKK